MSRARGNSIKSVSKAMNLLLKFSEQRREWGITELASELGMPKSTVHAIVKSLEEAQMLEQVKGNRYRLGVSAFQLGYVARTGCEVYSIAGPLLQSLFAQTNQIVYFAVPHLGRVLYIESYYQTPSIKVSYSIAGRTYPMHCTGLGKAMLSQMPLEDVEEIIDICGLPALTRYTICDRVSLLKELEVVREQGYAIDFRESDLMIACVAVPFRVRDGGLAAVSVSGAYTALTEEKVLEYVNCLTYTCTELSRRIDSLPFRVNPVPVRTGQPLDVWEMV